MWLKKNSNTFILNRQVKLGESLLSRSQVDLRFVAGFNRICHLRELLENRKKDRGFCNCVTTFEKYKKNFKKFVTVTSIQKQPGKGFINNAVTG